MPGPVCKYNWTKTWDVVKERNANQKARIFSYLTKDEGELFPGKLACENRFVVENPDGRFFKLYVKRLVVHCFI